jgi:hypothetical protein
MDLIREHLIYGNVLTTICFGTLKPQEQYECIRLLLATRTKDVKICKHDCTNKYIDKLLSKIDVESINCLTDQKLAAARFSSPTNPIF